MEVSDLWPDSIVAVGAMKRGVAFRLLERVELFLYARAKRIIALTASFKRNLVRRGVRADKIDVVINGADLSRYAPRDRDYFVGYNARYFVESFCNRLHRNHWHGSRPR